jgi:hypothetical protein
MILANSFPSLRANQLPLRVPMQSGRGNLNSFFVIASPSLCHPERSEGSHLAQGKLRVAISGIVSEPLPLATTS